MAGTFNVINDNHKLRVEMRGRLFGQEIRTRFGYLVANSSAAGSLATFKDEWITDVMTPLVTAMSQDFNVHRLVVRHYGTDGEILGEFEYAQDVDGGQASESLPPSTAVVIRKKSGIIGRNFNGRWYMPAPVLVHHDQGQLDGAGIIAWETAAEGLSATVEGAGLVNDFLPCIMKHSPVTGIVVEMIPILWTVVDPVLRNQRRRQIGVGI